MQMAVCGGLQWKLPHQQAILRVFVNPLERSFLCVNMLVFLGFLLWTKWKIFLVLAVFHELNVWHLFILYLRESHAFIRWVCFDLMLCYLSKPWTSEGHSWWQPPIWGACVLILILLDVVTLSVEFCFPSGCEDLSWKAVIEGSILVWWPVALISVGVQFL